MLDKYKENAIRDIREICKYKSENGKALPDNSRLSNKLINLRRSFKGKGNGKFYPEYLDIATECGYPDLFTSDTFEEIKANTLKTIQEICQYKLDHNGEDPPVYKTLIGRKLNTLKQVFKGNRPGKFHFEYIELAYNYGYTELFGKASEYAVYKNVKSNRKIKKRNDRKTSVALTIQDIKDICVYKNKHDGKNPPNDTRLSNKLGNLRQAYKNAKYTLRFKEIYLETATEYGYPELFESDDKEKIQEYTKQKSIEILNEIIQYKKEHNGKNPSSVEKLGKRFHDIKKIYNNNPEQYSELLKVSEVAGFPTLLSRRKYKTAKTEEILEKIEQA